MQLPSPLGPSPHGEAVQAVDETKLRLDAHARDIESLRASIVVLESAVRRISETQTKPA